MRQPTKLSRVIFFLGFALFCFLLSLTARAGSWKKGVFENEGGIRQYQLWVPTSYKATEARPLILALHGCKQNPDTFAAQTRLNQWADRMGLLVLYPAQAYLANMQNCWNWFFPFNQSRAGLEPLIAMGMVKLITQKMNVDRKRIYVMGLSAGAYMANTLLSCYADVFAAGMMASGGMYRAATNVSEAYDIRTAGSSYSPIARGREAWKCSGSLVPRQIPVLVIQGADDKFNAPINAQQTLKQFAEFNDLGDDGKANGTFTAKPQKTQQGTVPGGHAFVTSGFFAGNRLLMQYVLVDGMDHAWSGGDGKYPYTDPRGPDATAMALEFFSKFKLPR